MPDLPTFTLEHLATAVILLDGEARVVYLNPAAEHLFDVSGKNCSGIRCSRHSRIPGN